jgi:hypothetical protein
MERGLIVGVITLVGFVLDFFKRFDCMSCVSFAYEPMIRMTSTHPTDIGDNPSIFFGKFL